MPDKIIKSLEPFQEFFHSKFQQDNEETVEILLILVHGHIFEIFTLGQHVQEFTQFFRSLPENHVDRLCKCVIMYVVEGYIEKAAVLRM